MSKKSKRSAPRAVDASDGVSTAVTKGGGSHLPSQAAFRELIESIVIAFVLAFLFRTFEAEAFVIPTGSMATTLMGRHKDVFCPACGYPYQVGSSEEINQDTGALLKDNLVVGGTCPMCRYTDDSLVREPSFNGDRILVGKFAYAFADPERWDVAVFHYPADAKTNYIKRIVGLPGETIRIQHGDLFVKQRDGTEYEIARKPPDKLRAMLQTVYDNDYVLSGKLLAKGWPARWQPDDGDSGWQVSEDHKRFSSDGGQADAAWLRYRHFVPNPQVWEWVGRSVLPPDSQHNPQLITDFCAYNTSLEKDKRHETPVGLHWVGDLAVQCVLDVRDIAGSVVFELVEGGRRMRCEIDLSTGKAALSISGGTMAAAAATGIHKPGKYDILFSNIDDQLRLWVDNKLVEFDAATTYDNLGNHKPTWDDLMPVGIASIGANVEIDHLKVLRDIYYIADRETSFSGEPITDIKNPRELFGPSHPGGVAQFLSNPQVYDSAQMQSQDFPLKEDQFLALGDNSARSKDSRLWGSEYYVDRDLLIGKALFIYWPHSWDKIRLGGVDIPFPYFPNFARMQFVR